MFQWWRTSLQNLLWRVRFSQRVQTKKNMTDYEKKNFEETKKHVQSVQEKINFFVSILLERSRVHDDSKFSDDEAPYFARSLSELKGLTYGSDEYKAALIKLKPALDHHYRVNSHHPEYYENKVEFMDLIDIIEMFCDWWAATERHEDGDLKKSIDINTERFDLSAQLSGILKQTYERYVERI